ncbi:hypothetical protein [Coraliomargarita parva]|uniref:hypothetical protein n=1 Tax=Coraliomargarita parva TaxID=3014050 RepID=UPI0022B5ACF9|nr:hypothetical protein [Coraliomargarita parva]
MKLTYTFVASLLFVALNTQAQTLILLDTFNAADNTDLNADLSRQSGSASTINWTETEPKPTSNTAISSNQLLIGGSDFGQDYSAELSYDLGGDSSLTQYGEFLISFEIVSVANSYTSFALNADPGQTRPAVDDTTDFGLLFLGSSLSVRSGTSGVASSSTPLTGTVELTITTAAITSGTSYTVEMTYGGNTVDLNGGNAGTSYSGTWLQNDLYLSFSSRSGDSVIDNFSVTAIPEPSVATLFLGAIASLMIARRKQRA